MIAKMLIAEISGFEKSRLRHLDLIVLLVVDNIMLDQIDLVFAIRFIKKWMWFCKQSRVPRVTEHYGILNSKVE